MSNICILWYTMEFNISLVTCIFLKACVFTEKDASKLWDILWSTAILRMVVLQSGKSLCGNVGSPYGCHLYFLNPLMPNSD